MIGPEAVDDEVKRVAKINMKEIKPSEGNSKETIEAKRMTKNASPMKSMDATSFKTSERLRDSVSHSNLNDDFSKKKLHYDVSLHE